MSCNSVVPHNYCAFLPLNAGLEISTKSDVVVQKLEQVIGLLALEANDAASELRVDEQCLHHILALYVIDACHKRYLLSCGRVRANNRVDVGHRFSADNAVTRLGSYGLLVAGVHCLQAVQALLKLGTEAAICLCQVGKQSIAASWWGIERILRCGISD